MSNSGISAIEQEYLSSLSEKEYKGYEIAKDHLGSTFHLRKSNGFIGWLEKKKKEVISGTVPVSVPPIIHQ
jgi:hypothetical protein